MMENTPTNTPTNTPIGELEKKQLEELHHDIFTCFTSISYQDSAVIAESLYNKGYSKQKEGKWISVDERLPEEDTRVLVYLNIEKTDATTYTFFDTDRILEGRWVRWGEYISHWMSLPKPPKMKGS